MPLQSVKNSEHGEAVIGCHFPYGRKQRKRLNHTKDFRDRYERCLHLEKVDDIIRDEYILP